MKHVIIPILHFKPTTWRLTYIRRACQRNTSNWMFTGVSRQYIVFCRNLEGQKCTATINTKTVVGLIQSRIFRILLSLYLQLLQYVCQSSLLFAALDKRRELTDSNLEREKELTKVPSPPMQRLENNHA